MRRTLAAAALGVALLSLTACGGSDDKTSTSASPTAEATSAKPDYSANSKTTCTELKTKLETVPDNAVIQKAVTEAVKGKKTEAEINAAALTAVKKILSDWVAQIKGTAAKAEDPDLQAAILATESDIQTAISGVKSLDDVEKDLAAIDQLEGSKKVTTICKAAGVDLDA
jgi:hypothetical protein